jgi:hypothetical protein
MMKPLVYANNFESGVAGGITAGELAAAWSWSTDSDRTEPGWVTDPNAALPSAGKHGKFLGEFASETVELSLKGLPSRSQIDLQFKLFILRSWDGNNVFAGHPEFGPDRWSLEIEGGDQLLHVTFANDAPTSSSSHQSYPLSVDVGTPPETWPKFPPRTGAIEIDSLGISLGISADSVYVIARSFEHKDRTLKLRFAGHHLQEPSDESWGLDDILVLVTPLD